MEDKLIELLSEFGYPVIRQGSLAEDEDYPANFFTFWNNDSSDASHYDNATASMVGDFDVNFYSNSPANTYSILRKAIKILKLNGWAISGDGHDVASDEDSYTGRGVNALYLNSNLEED